jgi:hypothetical protein
MFFFLEKKNDNFKNCFAEIENVFINNKIYLCCSVGGSNFMANRSPLTFDYCREKPQKPKNQECICHKNSIYGLKASVIETIDIGKNAVSRWFGKLTTYEIKK